MTNDELDVIEHMLNGAGSCEEVLEEVNYSRSFSNEAPITATTVVTAMRLLASAGLVLKPGVDRRWRHDE